MESGRVFQLVMRRGPQPDKIFTLGKDYMGIGREAASEITISDPEISRQHSRLSRQFDGYIIEDLGSTNGTYVNGARISGAYSLMDGDEIGLGETVSLVYHVVDSTAPETIMSPSAAFDIVEDVGTKEPPDPFEAISPPEPLAEEAFVFEPEPAPISPPPFESESSFDAVPPSPFEPAPEPFLPPSPTFEPEPEPEPFLPPPPAFESEPEPSPFAPPPFPDETPVPSRAPTTAHPVAPPRVNQAGNVEEPKSRRGLLIGCGCLLLLVICAVTVGVGYLLWNAPGAFWDDPVGNFDRLFGIIMPLLGWL